MKIEHISIAPQNFPQALSSQRHPYPRLQAITDLLLVTKDLFCLLNN